MVEFLKKVLAFSLQQDLVFSHQSLAEEWLFFCTFDKKSKFCLEIVIMISKEYHYVITLGIIRNFYKSIDPVYPGFLDKRPIIAGEL